MQDGQITGTCEAFAAEDEETESGGRAEGEADGTIDGVAEGTGGGEIGKEV